MDAESAKHVHLRLTQSKRVANPGIDGGDGGGRATGRIARQSAPVGAWPRTRRSRREGMTRSSIAGILAKCPDHRLRVTIDDGQQHPGSPIGNASALFPFLKSPHIEPEAIGELLPAQPQPLAERDNPAGGGIVDDPTRQTRLATNMGENFAQRRFDLISEIGAFHRHFLWYSFLIAATRRVNALVSAGVRSSRSAFA